MCDAMSQEDSEPDFEMDSDLYTGWGDTSFPIDPTLLVVLSEALHRFLHKIAPHHINCTPGPYPYGLVDWILDKHIKELRKEQGKSARICELHSSTDLYHICGKSSVPWFEFRFHFRRHIRVMIS